MQPVEEILARTAELATAGKPREALTLAVERQRQLDDACLGAEVIRLRHLAFRPAASRPDWPPAFPDLFDTPGAPEINARDLTTEIMGSAIHHHGGLIVRGLIGEPDISRFKSGIDRALAGSLEAKRTKNSTAPWYAPTPASLTHHVNYARAFTEVENRAVLAADSPPIFQQMIDLYERAGLFNVIERYLGERPALSLGKTVLRRMPVSSPTDWHQDGAFLGADIRVVNCWVTLTDCGADAPGLDIVARRIPFVVEPGSGGTPLDWAVGDGAIEKVGAADAVQSPLFRAGDAMLFDHLFMHRTGARPNQAKSRYALEAWMFAPSTFPTETFPLAV